jgi:hypothetical protein
MDYAKKQDKSVEKEGTLDSTKTEQLEYHEGILGTC